MNISYAQAHPVRPNSTYVLHPYYGAGNYMEGKNVGGYAELTLDHNVSRIELVSADITTGSGYKFIVSDATGATSFTNTLTSVGNVIIPSDVASVKIYIQIYAAYLHEDYWQVGDGVFTFKTYY